MANFQIPAPPSGKRPVDTYQWLGKILEALNNTKGVDWHTNNILTIKELGDSIGNDRNFVSTVDNKITTAFQPVAIKASTDLNTLTTTGLYTSDSDGNAQTITNKPTGITTGFILQVYPIWGSGMSKRLVQLLYSRQNGVLYMRSKAEDDVWTPWINVITSADVTSTNNANKVVQRDASGNFSAGTITASLSGNATTATTLQTARTINGTSFNGSANITTANWGTARNITIGSTKKSVNGSADVSWSLSEIGAAAASHTHSYSNFGLTNKSDTSGHGISLYGGATSGAPSYGLMFAGTSTFGQHGSVTSDWATYFTMAGSTSRGWVYRMGSSNVASISGTGVVTASSFKGALSGNATTATTLQTARTINGTSFDGSANITTANWGTARTITIGSTGKSVNGSGNVSWSLSEIGAAAASHTHSYLPLSGGTITGSINYNSGSWNGTAIHLGAGDDSKGAYIGIGAGGLTIIGGGESTSAVRGGITNGSDERMIVANDYGIDFMTGLQSGFDSRKTVSISAAGVLSAPYGITGSLSGNASTATTLQTARTINGTSFDGSANITTANWGTARNITIGNTKKSVNGSADVSWSLSEIGVAAASHTHTSSQITDATNANTANMIVKRDGSGNFSAGTITASLSGNATTATTLQTARTINGTSFNGSANITTANWGTARTLTIGNTGKSVNGSANVSWSLNEIGAAEGYSVSATTAATAGWYRIAQTTSTDQDTVIGNFIIRAKVSGKHSTTNIISGISYGNNPVLQQLSHTQYTTTGISKVRLVYHTTHNGNKVYLEVYVPDATARTITVKLEDYYGWSLVSPSTAGSVPTDYRTVELTLSSNRIVSNITGSLNGNASTATTLQTARTINGTSFNGSANITTANWGTARTITIGNTGKSVNGSDNVSWSLSEIGAAASSHTHNYAGSSSAGGNANAAVKLATARSINGTSFDGSADITTANWGTARTLTIGNTGKSVNGSGNVSWSLSEIGAAAASHTHSNYVSTTDYTLTTITKTLTITTSWQDTGITGTNLKSGSYMIQVSGMSSDATSMYSEIFTGVMSWTDATTNSTDYDEIILHKAGHASNGRAIYLRTIRSSSSGYLKLQIAASTNFTSTSVTFKFRKLI